MKITINYKDTILKWANLTPIRGKPTFKTLHKLRNKIKANTKSVNSNIVAGAHGHIGLVLTDAQYALISPSPFFYPTHSGMLIIPDGTTAHTKSNMRISQTDEVHIFREVTGVEQALVQHIFSNVKEAYLVNICNRTTNSINDTVADVLPHPQDTYVQLMPHGILECE